MSELTAKQKAFIEELPKNQWNGTKAAIAAGYSAKNAGVMAHRLLKNPKIAEELAKRTAEIVSKTDVEVGEIIAALCTIAFGGRATNSDRLRALDLLGRYKGIFSEKRIIETVERQRELTEAEEEEARRLAAIRLRESG
jgi:phage terminase small subunit